eukprot:CAMPEP_0174743746 /NCGR_PEP_ID=MMETSP1094-20130205/82424_1 /TAXON_ID=156173 /ORGANISM="Chrysochromulina brevifilum, Strain UTEX LB 985" /LENGTH=65 /DNA_ID=CAMNT_0015948015 /DNA_START=318 /DNA_END=511 /DNA_ORIENTATION=+
MIRSPHLRRPCPVRASVCQDGRREHALFYSVSHVEGMDNWRLALVAAEADDAVDELEHLRAVLLR